MGHFGFSRSDINPETCSKTHYGRERLETFKFFLTLKTPRAVQFLYIFVFCVLYGTTGGGMRLGGETEGESSCWLKSCFCHFHSLWLWASLLTPLSLRLVTYIIYTICFQLFCNICPALPNGHLVMVANEVVSREGHGCGCGWFFEAISQALVPSLIVWCQRQGPSLRAVLSSDAWAS